MVKETAKTKTQRIKSKVPKKSKPLTPMDILKMEVAEELGLMDKVKVIGWGGLSAAETGKIGGIMTKKMKERGTI